MARMEDIKYRRTAYEIVLERGEARYLVAYSEQYSRDGLIKALRNRAHHVLRVCGLGEDARFTCAKRSADGVTIGEWRVRFSGRTHRDAICSGELPYVAA